MLSSKIQSWASLIEGRGGGLTTDQGTQGWASGEKGRPGRGPGLGRMEAAPGPAAGADRRTENSGQWRAAAGTGWATVCSRRGGRWRVAAADRERERESEREREGESDSW
jgi:hypothetical protein